MSALELISDLTCPLCGHGDTLAMPTDACLFFHECTRCHAILRPKAGDCCVFCSYGSVPCPPIQTGGGCGASHGVQDGVQDGAGSCGGAGRPLATGASRTSAAGGDA